jgi:alpha-D-xyloside xylohydrolase
VFFVETDETTEFIFHEEIRCRIPSGASVFILTGSADEMFADYVKLAGGMELPPEYAFGTWISANHWNCQGDVEEAVRCLKKYRFPAAVLVLEAWSDESTFYIFNGAKYSPFREDSRVRYEDFDFSESRFWSNPKELIDTLHAEGIRLVLWQIPVYKKMEDGRISLQNQLDSESAVRGRLCVMNSDGTPYAIPDGHWFEGSLIPDFTNPAARKSWFDRREYLLDIGVDGFKTDGGEFIYSDDVILHDGTSGIREKNRYCQDYLNAYHDFIGKGRVLFSRAGFTGAQKTPIHWAGDHQSTNEEFKAVLSAGLSASVSGVVFWSFDIGGFAGPLPSDDLYLRSTMMACFSPVMQWHSEPDGGQFSKLMPGGEGSNERSPWNICLKYGEDYLHEIRYWHWLRMNLMPYIFSTAGECVRESRPMMKPLVFDWQDDEKAVLCEDEYLFGDSLLVAPLMEEKEMTRTVYLPKGRWHGFFSKKGYEGPCTIDSCEERFPVYIRDGYAVILKKETDIELGSPMDCARARVHFILAGKKGHSSFDDSGRHFEISWDDSGVVTAEDREDESWEIYD